ncbi:MAG: hypothetical protein WAV53_17480, partial [Anaerolineae bacterium]
IGRRVADLTGPPVDHFQGIAEMRLPAQKGVVLGDQAFALGDRLFNDNYNYSLTTIRTAH